MKLINLKYKFDGDWDGFNYWSLDNLDLNKINLIVGKNAVGKSRIIRLLSGFKRMITTAGLDAFVDDAKDDLGIHNWHFEFLKDNGDILIYNFVIESEFTHSVKSEEIILNGLPVLIRDSFKTELFSVGENQMIKIKPPHNKLAFHVRRDEFEYPYFEDIVIWGERCQDIDFKKNINQTFIEKIFRNLNPIAQKNVIDDMKKLEYFLENISVMQRDAKNYLSIKEIGLKNNLLDSQLSQGMHRALRILVGIEFLMNKESTTLISIDDLGEGLDYERATKLGKLLVEKLENSNIQFIATSNDSFLMDVVPIKYWNILQRDGNTVKSLNYQNSKERFDKFLMTGLSNFDLFSSDYLMRPTP